MRTSDPERLATALRQHDLTATPGDGGAVLAETTDLRAVGEIAHAAGLPVWELTAKAADLEELFLELTAGGNRNLGDGSMRGQDGAA